MQPAVGAIIILLLGMLIGRALKRETPPLVIQRNIGLSSQPSQGAPMVQSPSPGEQVYICGARTKKGTPCSRRVQAPVRCWQHKGAPAMLPIDKLIVKD